MTTAEKSETGHQIPLHPWQLPSSLLHASPGKQVSVIAQSCQQHTPAGVGAVDVVVVVVTVPHFSWHKVTHAGKTAGLVGHPLMHATRQLGGGGAGVSVVVAAGQSDWHTPTQISYASPLTTEQALIHASIDPPGQAGVGDGTGDGVGAGIGLGGGVGTGVGGAGGGAGAVAKMLVQSIWE